MLKAFDDLYQLIWQEVFPEQNALNIPDFLEYFTKDIPLPKQFKCEIKKTPVFSSPEYMYEKFISPEALLEEEFSGAKSDQSNDVSNLSDLLNNINSLFLFKGNRSLNSDTIESSDDVQSSSIIYNSCHIYSCQKVLFSNNVVESEYLLASMGSRSCNFSIRCLDSTKTSNSFDISYSANMAHSYFCHNCFDLRDCMFCFHLVSKQYCIGNMQFTKDEYQTIKNQLLADYFAQIDQKNAFITLESYRRSA